MAEKRRATTFRTSKGTIVNVQYPDIYVSPAFISTEDVTNPTEMREALREELLALGLVHPLIGAKWAVKRFGVVLGKDFPVANAVPGNPSVIKDEDLYRIYFAYIDAGDIRIGSATSYEGRVWTTTGVAMTAAIVNAAGFNVTWVAQPCVVKENGVYYLFFTGDQLQAWGRREQVFLATGTNGTAFTNIKAVLTPIPNSMEEGIHHPWVLKFRDKYYMVYIGIDHRIATPLYRRLFTAESSDLLTWVRTGESVLEGALNEWDSGAMFDHSLFNVNDMFVLMVYAASPIGAGGMRAGICYSFDIKHFFGRRMLLARVLAEEANFIADSSILYEGGKLKIWYEGADAGGVVRTLYAEAVMGGKHIMELWDTKTVVVAGDNTDDIDTKFDKKTFYVISDQAATVGTGNEGLFIQAFDEIAGDFKTVDSVSVAAATLTPYMTTYDSRRMRLRFVPSAQAIVSAWVVME